MGRYDYSSRTEADNVKKISVNFLNKHNYFCGYNSGTITWTRTSFGEEHKSSVGIAVTVNDTVNQLRIHYTQTEETGEKKDFDYNIPLIFTPCRYGGKRWWFRCPWYKNNVYCGRRVGTLYKNGDYFACRHCYNLTYASRKVNRNWKYGALFSVYDLDEKIQDLHKIMKKKTYRGKPTRKYKKLLKLYRQADASEKQIYEVSRMLGIGK